jgi:tRNA threonylcarbamoyladenosine biosynthesis protein TsaB
MKVLALELSSPVGSVAYCDDDGGRDLRVFPADRKHSGFFYENLEAAYGDGKKPDVIVVGVGPGSYAGVRIAIATAIGLQAACGARLRGLPSICAIDRPEYLFVGDARRNSYFFAHVNAGEFVEGPTLGSLDEISLLVAAAPDLPVIATEPLPPFEEATIENPSALRLVEIATDNEQLEELPFEPIYLRPPYITTPRR